MANQDLVPTNKEFQGSSPLYKQGTTPNTRTAVSQKVRLIAPGYGTDLPTQMGVVSSFGFSESRAVDPVRGIGFGDQIAELVPGVTDPASLSFERALLYQANLWQATGYAGGVDGPVRSLRHHRWPFDVESQLVFSTIADNDVGTFTGGDGFTAGNGTHRFRDVSQDSNSNPQGEDALTHNVIITLYEACWWNDYSYNFAADSGIIMESGTATCTDVHNAGSDYGEFLATGNDPSIGQDGTIRYGDSFDRNE